jgi:hypothetical protein
MRAHYLNQNILHLKLHHFYSCQEISVAEPHHFYAAPAPGKNFDVAPAPAVPAPAPAPTLLYS